MYFSVITTATIGYGDYAPKSEMEMIYVSSLAIIANGIFAYSMTQI